MSLTDHMHPDELVSSAGALWRDGHVLMRGVLDGDSVSSLRPEFVQTVEQHRAEWPTKVLRAKKETVGGTQAQFDRIFGVRRKTGAGEQLASSTRLASIAAALLGVPCVAPPSAHAPLPDPPPPQSTSCSRAPQNLKMGAAEWRKVRVIHTISGFRGHNKAPPFVQASMRYFDNPANFDKALAKFFG